MLPQVYRTEIDIRGWWMSEKLDGVRAYWDGEALYSKNGVVFNPRRNLLWACPLSLSKGNSGVDAVPLQTRFQQYYSTRGIQAGWNSNMPSSMFQMVREVSDSGCKRLKTGLPGITLRMRF